MMKNVFTKEAKIGLVTLVSLVLLYFGVNYLRGINLFQPVNHYFVSFTNVKDVTISSPVFVEGFKVGLVRSITYDYQAVDKITVEISLEDEMKINKGSYITIVKSFLGGAELHIHLNKYITSYYQSGETIEGRMGEDMMTSVQENILPQIENILPKLDSILGGIQALVSHPALSQSFEHIERTTSNLEKSTLKLNSLLIKDVPIIMSDLKTITGNFSTVSNELTKLDFNKTLNTIDATLNSLRRTTDKLNSPDNSMGLLLNDTQLYNNLNSTAENASKLLIDFKQNPKRYVRFSVF